MAFNLSTMNISDIASTIQHKLDMFGVDGKSELIIYVDGDEFRKVDEDLYYRNRSDDGEKFTPSDGEVVVGFGKLTVKVVSDEPENTQDTILEKWKRKLKF